MSRDRQLANALSDGINCIAAIIGSYRSDTPPSPDWPVVLCEMEAAFDAIAAHEVTTSLEVAAQDREQLRRLNALVSQWIANGRRPPDELHIIAESILALFGDPGAIVPMGQT